MAQKKNSKKQHKNNPQKGKAHKRRSDRKMITTLLVIVLGLIGLVTYLAMGVPSQPLQPTPQSTASTTHPKIDNIPCEAMEGTALHIHPVLTVINDGNLEPIPQGIGIPADGSCFYWLHTHDSSGQLHVESPVQRTFTLGEFFDIWGQPLSKQQVGPFKSDGQDLHIYVDNQPYTGDPRAIALKDKEQIVVEVGPKFITPQAAEKLNPPIPTP